MLPTGGNTVDLKVMASDGSATVADTFTLTIAAQMTTTMTTMITITGRRWPWTTH